MLNISELVLLGVQTHFEKQFIGLSLCNVVPVTKEPITSEELYLRILNEQPILISFMSGTERVMRVIQIRQTGNGYGFKMIKT